MLNDETKKINQLKKHKKKTIQVNPPNPELSHEIKITL